MMPPEMSGLDRGLSGIYNLGTMMGGNGPQLNPITQAFDQRVQNYELQNQRLNAIRSGASNEDPLVRGVKQYAEAAGITNLPWDEQVAAYRKAKFADPKKSVYSERVEGLVASGIDETLANQYVNGAVEARTGPGGITQLINTLTGEVEATLSAEQAAIIESTVAQGKSFGENIGPKIETAISDLNAIGGEELVLNQAVEGIDYWTEKLSEKDADGNYIMDTGLIQGLMTDLGVSGFSYGELAAKEVEQKLRNLQIVNLAPVTERELKLLGKLFAGNAVMNEQNLGTLKGYLRRVKDQQAEVSRRKGNAIFTLDANYDYLNAPNRAYLNNRYGSGEEGSWRPATADSVRFKLDE
jgi:hypothetical protein